MRYYLSIPPQLQICYNCYNPLPTPFTNAALFVDPSSITNLFFLLSLYKCGTIYQSLPNYNLQIPQLQICSSFCPIYKCGTIFQYLPNYKFALASVPFTNVALFVNPSSIYKFVLPNIARFVPPSVPFTNAALFVDPSSITNLFFLLSHLQMRHHLSIPPQLQFTNTSITNLFFLLSHLQMRHHFSIPPQLQICSCFRPIYKCGTVCQSLLNYNLQICSS